jgi:N,N-dimethylformamidase beta subunit-like, C-terminal
MRLLSGAVCLLFISAVAGLPETRAAAVTCGDVYRQPGWVKAENQRAGTTAWQIPTTKLGGIEGYADHASAQCGDVIHLYISTSSPYFRVVAYRMGYYQGLGARQIWQSGPHAGFLQPTPAPSSTINMIEAQWKPSLTFTVDGSWPPGDYLLRLITTDYKSEHYIPLTVRDDLSTSGLILQNDVSTWQAYNDWGGYSLYHGPNGFSDRSRVVSYDRPYRYSAQSSGGQGDGQFLLYDYPLVRFVEELGLDVSYWTDIDLHERPQLLLNHRALITMSHDEYWSTKMRSGVETALSHGINLAFFGADAVQWVTRFQSSPVGPDREQIVYKSAAEDPLTGIDDADVSVRFRDTPVSNPQSKLIGEESDCSAAKADMVVTDASHWIFAGTGLSNGSVLPMMVGYESDRVDGYPHPANLQILADSPFLCAGRSWSSNMTYYSAASGAGVLATGTISWLCVLTASCKQVSGNAGNQSVVRQITKSVLTRFAAGPAR